MPRQRSFERFRSAPNLGRALLGLLLPAIFVLGFFAPRAAHAHDPFETTTKVLVRPDGVDVEMIMARATAEALFGKSAVPEVGASWSQEPPFEGLYDLTSGGRPLGLLSKRVEVGFEGEAKDDFVFQLEFSEPQGETVSMTARYLERLEQGYTGVVQVIEAGSTDLLDIKVLHSSDSVLRFPVPAPVVTSAGETRVSSKPVPRTRSFGLFLWIGVAHVIFGFDHLLFLLSVLLACRRLRQIVGILTTFTLAHSVTLSLAAFDVLPLVSEIVEPLIALSIAVAAFWGRALEARGLLLPMTFAFGLIHGLGFAAGLQALVDAGNVRILGLVGFNLGVEFGQIVAACALLPLLRWCRRSIEGRTTLDWTARAVGATGGAIFLWRIVA